MGNFSFMSWTWGRVLRVVGALGCLAFLLAACQADGVRSVSLDQAKRITTEFRGGSYVAPPRSIDDVVTSLSEAPDEIPASIAQMRETASAPVPENAKGDALVKFYAKRGNARNQLGLTGLRLEDMRQLVALLPEKGGGDQVGKYLREAAWAELAAGNFRDAINMMERSAKLLDSPSGSFSGLVRFYAWIGDLEGAETARRRFSRTAKANSSWTPIHSGTVEASILEAQGRWAEAEPHWRRSLKFFLGLGEDHRIPIWSDGRRLEIALNLMRQGRLAEAELVIREALEQALNKYGTKNHMSVARLLGGFSQILVAQGRAEDAETLAREALVIIQAIEIPDGSVLSASRHLDLGAALVAQGNYDEAAGIFAAAADSARGNDLIHQVIVRKPNRLLAFVRAGRGADVLPEIRALVSRNRQALGEKHYATAEARALLASALVRNGSDREALEHFRAVVPLMLQRSRQTDDDSGSALLPGQRLVAMLEDYMDLLQRIQGGDLEREVQIDAAAEAFRISNAARSRDVEQAVAASAARAQLGDPELIELARREQDAQKQISALYGVLANATTSKEGQADPEARTNLRRSIDQLRGSRAALMEEIETRFPDYARLINPQPATVEDVQQSLRRGESLINFYVATDKTFIWAIPAEGKITFAVADIGRDKLNETIDELRLALDPQAVSLGDIPEFDVALAHELYQLLLEPVGAGWKDAKQLLVVKHAGLGQLPLSVLVTEDYELGSEGAPLFARYKDVPWLARTHAINVLPSATSLATLRRLPVSETRKAFLGFGDPWFNAEQAKEARAGGAQTQVAELATRGLLQVRGLPLRRRAAPATLEDASAQLGSLPRLPDTADEIRSIALALNADLTTDVFIGDRVSETAIKSMDLSGIKVIAFATHGLVAGDLDGLNQPALALSSPLVVGGEDDGLLTMGEILGLRLDADWVVLSACNTGSANGAGAEAISGLGHAFFYAGARALLVTNWPVETASARLLTTELFRLQSETPSLARAQALRQSMLSLIDGDGSLDAEGRTVHSYAHPIFWAPFSLIGDGGGAGSPA